MGSSSEIIDIATSARRIGVDNRISLKFYFRIADNILKQADIFRAEKNVIDLYVMLLRFSSLALETIPSHRDYRTSLKSNKEYLRMRLLDVLTELEKLKPVVQQRIDELYPKLKPRYNVQAHPANGSLGWSSAVKPSLNSYDHAKVRNPPGHNFGYMGSRGQQFLNAAPLEERFRKMSVNFRPNEETLSRHSILGPGGLSAQWQPPKYDTKVQYPSNIDFSPVVIPSFQQFVDSKPMITNGSNDEPERPIVEPSVASSENIQKNYTEELSSMISFEEPESVTDNNLIRQPSPPPVLSKLSSASALASGIVLGLFEDGRYKSESKKPSLKSVDIIGFGTGAELEKKLKYAEDVSYGVIFGRELTNSPANVLTPAVLAEEAAKVASTYSDVFTANILNEEQCRKLKMGSYLAVAAASANPPYFIHLVYKPSSGSVKTKLALVGKGLTFDSGGYNIKTGPGCLIELMKLDMGGSAAVLGAAKAIGEIKPPGVEVHFIVAACENMISGTGMRPGDVITASNGKTIEVNNTDAEGRLTLADALVYACNQGVDKIVDLATLTGACVIALGTSMAGIYTPSDELAKEVIAASERSGEKLWRMPLEESYWEMMKSGVADMVNTGGRAGGSITAALFLKQFVSEKVQWMHIDMAGPAWNEKKKSGTGFGVATLVEWVQKNSSS